VHSSVVGWFYQAGTGTSTSGLHRWLGHHRSYMNRHQNNYTARVRLWRKPTKCHTCYGKTTTHTRPPMHILGHSWGDGIRLMHQQQYRHSVESRWLVVYRGLVENRVAMVIMM
jgi:hypothetical protein